VGTQPGICPGCGLRSLTCRRVAACRHDIGYAPGLAATGLYALGGACYLRDVHQSDVMLCRLVACYSCAIFEAGERGLTDVLALKFEPVPYVFPAC
jgi:hypothetical protein